MFTGMLHTHVLAATLFVLIFLVKTILLFTSDEALDKFTAKMKMLQNIVTVLFLATGIYLSFNSGNLGSWFHVKLVCLVIVIPMAIVGFKKKNKILGPLSFLILLYMYGISETKSHDFKPSADTSVYENIAPEQLGFEVYKAECNTCHGPDGNLGMSGSKDLSASIMVDDELKGLIANGKNAMPGFSGKLNEEQIDAVASYVKELRREAN